MVNTLTSLITIFKDAIVSLNSCPTGVWLMCTVARGAGPAARLSPGMLLKRVACMGGEPHVQNLAWVHTHLLRYAADDADGSLQAIT